MTVTDCPDPGAMHPRAQTVTGPCRSYTLMENSTREDRVPDPAKREPVPWREPRFTGFSIDYPRRSSQTGNGWDVDIESRAQTRGL